VNLFPCVSVAEVEEEDDDDNFSYQSDFLDLCWKLHLVPVFKGINWVFKEKVKKLQFDQKWWV